MDRGALQATVHEATRVGHDLKTTMGQSLIEGCTMNMWRGQHVEVWEGWCPREVRH